MAHILAKDLRAAVLQAAMQGKLTEQLPEDGNAKDLLNRIRNDKEDKIHSKVVKRDKRLDLKFEQDSIYDTPESWCWCNLGNLLYKLTDGTHKTPKYTTSGVKFVSVKDMSSGRLSLDNTKYISEEEHKELFGRCNPQYGDMLISKVGTTGVPAMVDTYEEFSLFVSVALLKYNHEYVFDKYLYYLLGSPLVQQQAAENTKGIGNKNWVLDKIASTVVVLPPYPEQKRIVARVDELMAKIDEYEKIENQLVELHKNFPSDMKAAVLQAAMQGKLTKQLESDGDVKEFLSKIGVGEKHSEDYPFDIPDSWKWCKYGDLGTLKSGYAFKSSQYKNKGIQVVRISDLDEDAISVKDAVYYEESAELERYKIVKGSFLICLTGSIGKMARVNDSVPRYLNQRVGMYIPKNEMNTDYLWKYIHSNMVVGQWIKSKTSTNGNIKNSQITELLIPVPPLEEQQRIVDVLDRLLPVCDSLQAMI